jgi:hypothetical protein
VIGSGSYVGVGMAARQRRVRSLDEAWTNVRRAKELAERYGIAEANPADFLYQAPEQAADWDDLLKQMK